MRLVSAQALLPATATATTATAVRRAAAPPPQAPGSAATAWTPPCPPAARRPPTAASLSYGSTQMQNIRGLSQCSPRMLNTLQPDKEKIP
ncbi:MAG: hypothetical protein ACI4PZ_00325 [Akkermansia sp.]